MSNFRTPLVGAMVAIGASGLAWAPVAQADQQYKADRAYCMSGQASEARTLCLKEAAAAQADRQRGTHGTPHRAHHKSKSDSSQSPGKGASAP